MHTKIHDPAHIKGVRTVAIFEFAKGLLLLLAGLGILRWRHRDIWGVAESFLEFFHLNPHHRYVGVFIDLVYRIRDVRLWEIALVAFLYAILRFVEGYGLWYTRPWAEWLAIASGSIYIPFEVADIFHKPHPMRFLILGVNVAIVLYMVMLRLEAAKNATTPTHKKTGKKKRGAFDAPP